MYERNNSPIDSESESVCVFVRVCVHECEHVSDLAYASVYVSATFLFAHL